MRGQKISLHGRSSKAEDNDRVKSRSHRERMPLFQMSEEIEDTENGFTVEESDEDEDEDMSMEEANKLSTEYYRKKMGLPSLKGRSYINVKLPNSAKLNRNISKRKIKPSKEEYKVSRLTTKASKNNKISSIIFKFLLRKRKPAHTLEIIKFLKSKKLLNKDKQLFHYSQVYKIMSSNNAYFEKVNKSTFKIRDGFRKSKKVKSKPLVVSKPKDTSLTQLIIDTMKKISVKENQKISSRQVFAALRVIGFNGSYKNIYQAMQSPIFAKSKTGYSLRK